MKQTLIKITDDHYVVVDKTIQPVNGYYYDDFIKGIRNTSDAEYGDASHCWQITHSTQPNKGMENVTFISPREVKELIGEVDLEKKAINSWEGCDGCDANDKLFFINGYQKGYNQAIENNKEKKYTEEDLRKAISETRRGMLFLDKYVNEFIQSLQPKTEWDVKFIDGKLKLI